MKKESANAIVNELKQLGDPQRAVQLRHFFKTGPGEYGEGDRFLGLTVPAVRKVVRGHAQLSLVELEKLLAEPWHEARLAALLILVGQFNRGDDAARRHLYNFYLSHIQHINNWDLVDLSAPHIIGGWLLRRSRAQLFKLVRSRSLWKRRIAILATFNFIRHNEFDDALSIAEKLLGAKEDLLHKATGWMLREIGKRDQKLLEGFLREHYTQLPRTMLRYAIERFPEKLRKQYLKGFAATD